MVYSFGLSQAEAEVAIASVTRAPNADGEMMVK